MSKPNFSKFNNLKNTVIDDDYGVGKVSKEILNNEEPPSEITYIDLDDLIFNPRNDKTLDMNTDDLVATIPTMGLIHAIMVRRSEDNPSKYYIISGERRTRAYLRLWKETGEIKYRSIPAIIKDLNKVALPLNDELKEEYIIATPNNQKRKDKFSTKYHDILRMYKIYDELKKQQWQGVQKYSSVRQYVSTELNIPETEIQRILSMGKNLIDSVKTLLDENALGKTVALEMTRMTHMQQKELLLECQEKNIDTAALTTADIKRYINLGTVKKIDHEKVQNSNQDELVNTHELITNLKEIEEKLTTQNVSDKIDTKVQKELMRIQKSIEKINSYF